MDFGIIVAMQAFLIFTVAIAFPFWLCMKIWTFLARSTKRNVQKINR